MDQEPKKKTTRNLIAGIGIGVLAVLGLAASATSTPSVPASVTTQNTPLQQQPEVPLDQQVATPQAQADSPNVETTNNQTGSGLSNDNYYKNVSGNTVHDPAYSNDSSVPAGATAQCGDGTYSFSQHHSGTCSHHGGVSQWL